MKIRLAALALALLPVAAAAEPVDLKAALEAGDVAALEQLGQGFSFEGSRDLALGAAAALRGEDAAALARLTAAAGAPAMPDDSRALAWSAAAGVYLRQGRFADAASAFEAAAAASGEAESDGALQAHAFALAAAGAPVMQAVIGGPGETPLARDLAGLPRATIQINGTAQEILIDTGANYSTVMESVAEALGMRLIEADVSVTAAAVDAAPARLAVADTLRIAGAEFNGVVFIVMPDEALSFADGIYTIPAILGLPVLRSLGRVSFVNEGEREWLRHEPSAGGWSEASNLVLSGLNPLVLAEANGQPVRLFLDSGAGESHLSPRALAEFPSLADGTGARDARIGGAGGERVFEAAPVIPELVIAVAGREVVLKDVDVLGDGSDGRHGLMGQDVLGALDGFVVDFGAMRFELIGAAPAIE